MHYKVLGAVIVRRSQSATNDCTIDFQRQLYNHRAVAAGVNAGGAAEQMQPECSDAAVIIIEYVVLFSASGGIKLVSLSDQVRPVERKKNILVLRCAT